MFCLQFIFFIAQSMVWTKENESKDMLKRYSSEGKQGGRMLGHFEKF